MILGNHVYALHYPQTITLICLCRLEIILYNVVGKKILFQCATLFCSTDIEHVSEMSMQSPQPAAYLCVSHLLIMCLANSINRLELRRLLGTML